MIRNSLTVSTLLFLPLYFAAGYLVGKVDLDSVIRITKESYVNRYLSVSGAQRDQVTYYLYSNQAERILSTARSIPGILSITQAGPKNFYDVVITYPQRREAVKTLRGIPGVSTVFTVPLICH